MVPGGNPEWIRAQERITHCGPPQESCPRNRTADSVFLPQLFIGCGANRVEPLSGTAALLGRGTHLGVRKCFLCDIYAHHSAASPRVFAWVFQPTFASLCWDQTVMFSRNKKRRDDGSREVGSTAKSLASPWRTQGGVLVTKTRVLLFTRFFFFCCNFISLTRDSSSWLEWEVCSSL